jgi:hypothetical protein
MTQLQIELPDEVVVEVERRAESQGLSVARFVTELVAREVGKGWPKWFFEEVVGGWKGEALERPAPLPMERREEF